MMLYDGVSDRTDNSYTTFRPFRMQFVFQEDVGRAVLVRFIAHSVIPRYRHNGSAFHESSEASVEIVQDLVRFWGSKWVFMLDVVRERNVKEIGSVLFK
jgi:hypothetical protein